MSASENTAVVEGTSRLFSREAEDAVLGACLINQDVFPLVWAIVAPGDFYIHRNRWIFEAMESLWRREDSIDVVTVSSELGAERLHDIGGRAYLTALTNASVSSLNAESYASIVARHALRRRFFAAGQNIMKAVFREELEPADLAGLVHFEVEEASKGIKAGDPRPVADVLAEVSQRARERAQGEQMPGISTGFARLDLMLGGGLRPGQLITVAAYPGEGKTSLLTQIAINASRSCRARLHSLEMNANEIACRMLAQASGLNTQAIDAGQLGSEAEWERLEAASKSLGALQLEIDDTARMSVALLGVTCFQNPADLLVIDGTDLLDSRGDGEYEQQRGVSGDLKKLARKLGIPILVSHQLNRRGHEYEAPKLYHLRGSGTWEQDSDVVLILSRKDEPTRRGGVPCRLEIAKQRNGPTGFVDLLFKPEITKFEEAD